MSKVYSYVRFSSKAQASGDSLRRQTALTEDWVIRHGHELDESMTYRDLGVSAYDRTNLRTGALGLFLRAAQQGRIERGSILAIEALDRLTRAEPLDAFRLLSDIVSCGISIVTVTDERVYDESSLNGDFASLMLAAALLVRGHEESKRKSGRLKDYYSERRANSKGRIAHYAPNWIEPDDANGWRLIPEHAETVRLIFQLSSEGIGASTIARRFNDAKRPMIDRNLTSDINWHPSTISKLLRNRAVIGEYHPHSVGKEGQRESAGEPIPNHYPSALSEELFWRVQSMLSERIRRDVGHRRDKGYSNVLAGMLFCGYCGASMFLEKKAVKRKNVSPVTDFYYGCSKATRRASQCVNRVNYRALLLGAAARPRSRFPRPLRLGLLQAIFEHLLMRGDQLSASAEQQQELARQRHDVLSGQIADIEARKSILIDSLENGVLTLTEVQPRLDRIRAELALLQPQLASILLELGPRHSEESKWIEEAVENHMATIVPILTELDLSDERAALRTRLLQRIERIYLYRDCARLKLRHVETPLYIPLEETADIANAEKAYPLPPGKDQLAHGTA